ncbi:hypothetical protein Ddye_026235 [Dipteronia dyeriana]|uniref:DUF4283 domain-containing protein n=1 Tax=Dipteronia dyeriana TaxID=168575 RepID=A0AAD9TMW5_9ROSI|nr:hypothetical protein Ddye_026235 [Dipteronia dyeriana]
MRANLGWISIKGVPLIWWNEEFFLTVGKAFGEPVMVDDRTISRRNLMRGRLLVLKPEGKIYPSKIKVVHNQSSIVLHVEKDASPVLDSWVEEFLGLRKKGKHVFSGIKERSVEPGFQIQKQQYKVDKNAVRNSAARDRKEEILVEDRSPILGRRDREECMVMRGNEDYRRLFLGNKVAQEFQGNDKGKREVVRKPKVIPAITFDPKAKSILEKNQVREAVRLEEVGYNSFSTNYEHEWAFTRYKGDCFYHILEYSGGVNSNIIMDLGVVKKDVSKKDNNERGVEAGNGVVKNEVVDTEGNILVWNFEEEIARVVETRASLGFDFGGKEKVLMEVLKTKLSFYDSKIVSSLGGSFLGKGIGVEAIGSSGGLVSLWNEDYGCCATRKPRKVIEDRMAVIDNKAENDGWDENLRKDRLNLLAKAWSGARKNEQVWRQKLRVQWLKEGDKNSKFFHVMASRRKRRNYIGNLQVEGISISDPTRVRDAILRYFQNHFQKVGWHRPKINGLNLLRLEVNVGDGLEAAFSLEEV